MTIPKLELIKVQELVAVKEGIKPVLRRGFDKSNLNEMKALCEKNKLYLMVNVASPEHKINQPTIAYISRSGDLAKKACAAERENDIKLGELLGYPRCCVDEFERRTSRMINDKFSFVLNSFSLTRGKPSFYVNNIFNFQSRLGNSRKLEIFLKNLNVFGEYNKYFLISHVPCSYNCKESIRLGKEILNSVENENPEYCERITNALENIFLVFDDFNWVAFDGKVEKNVINYRKITPYKSIYPEDKFREGNKVIVAGKEILIMNGNETIHTIKKDSVRSGTILDFS